MGRFATQWLATASNLAALTDLSGQWIDLVHIRRPPRGIVLDMDSSVSPTHGEQELSVWNGHYQCTCYHPLFVFNQFGDLERCVLRPGNVHSADGWEGVLKPVIVRYQGKVLRIYFRADAAFAMPGVYECLEAERVKYAIRLPANQVLQNRIAYLLKRPVGRPPNEVRRYYANFTYQAASWTKPRRVIAKVEWHPGELYPRVGFIVTNMSRPAERRSTARIFLSVSNYLGPCHVLQSHFIADAVRGCAFSNHPCRSDDDEIVTGSLSKSCWLGLAQYHGSRRRGRSLGFLAINSPFQRPPHEA